MLISSIEPSISVLLACTRFGFGYIIFGLISNNSTTLDKKLFFKTAQILCLPGYVSGFLLIIFLNILSQYFDVSNNFLFANYKNESQNKKIKNPHASISQTLTVKEIFTIGLYISVQSAVIASICVTLAPKTALVKTTETSALPFRSEIK